MAKPGAAERGKRSVHLDLGHESHERQPLSRKSTVALEATPSQTPSHKATTRVTSRSASIAGSLAPPVETDLEDVLLHLTRAELKSFKATTHQKSRTLLRALSFPALPPQREKTGRGGATASAALARAQRAVPRGAEKSKISAFERALWPGSPVQRAQVADAARPFAADLATEACADGAGSLEWVNLPGLAQELAKEEGATRFRNMEFILARSSPRSPAPEESSQPVQFTNTQPTFLRRYWPSMSTFEQYYEPPPEMVPSPREPSAVGQLEPLPPGRQSISAIEESLGYSVRQDLWPQMHSVNEPQEPPPSAGRQRPPKPAGIFEAAALYRTTCKDLGIAPLEKPAPLFSTERVEINDTVHDLDTRQCYAIAKTIRLCNPREILLSNAFVTDMGCAEIIEGGLASGQLSRLHANGCLLGTRTCAALYKGLRTRATGALVDLKLGACGLGGEMDDGELSDLRGKTAAIYTKSKAALLGGAQVNFDSEATLPWTTEQEDESSEDSDLSDSDATSKPAERLPLLLPLLCQLAQPGCALRALDLSGSVISTATAELLGRVLETSALEKLLLNGCGMSDDALLSLATGVGQNRWLLDLQLRGNRFSGLHAAPAALLDAAGRHSRLAHLDLADNVLKASIASEICAAMRWSLSLVAIHVLSTTVAIPDASSFAEACRNWLEQNARGGTPGMEGDDSQPAILASPTPPSLAATFQISLGINGEKGEAEVEPPSGELVLCRALHVDGLQAWRVVQPVPKPPVPQSPPAGTSSSQSEEPATVPRSWMPAGCWVCSRCQPVEYEWVVPDDGPGSETGGRNTRIFVRPSFAGFGRVELKRQRVAGARRVRFSSKLLVPPGGHTHVYEAAMGSRRRLFNTQGDPTVDMGEAKLNDSQREVLERLCRQHRCGIRLNLLPKLEAADFEVPEPTRDEPLPETEAGDWDDDPERRRRFRQCYDTDLRDLHLTDLCHAAEEPEVLQTLWELYPRLYETYAVVAGRSQWPLVRQVDIYGFFDEVRLLQRTGPLAALGMDEEPYPDEADFPRLELQDVQQMILQTFAPKRISGSSAGRKLSRRHAVFMHGSGSGDPTNPVDETSSLAAAVHQRTREGAPVTRPQFIEVLLRAAIALSNAHPSASRSFRTFADAIISGRVRQPPLAPFPRGVPLQAGEVADTLLARRRTLREAWERFGCSESAFQRFAQFMKLCDRAFTAKHVSSIYAVARRPRADFREVGAKKPPGLRYDEFCEAVSRLALVWRRPLRSDEKKALAGQRWPPQPQAGRPVRQIALAARLEAFLAKLAERLRPSVMNG